MLSLNFCNKKIRNPVVLASGILGVTKSSLKRIAQQGAGAVTIKSISAEERKGHNNPVIITYEAGMINAVGYSNPGITEAKKEFNRLSEVNVPVIASIIGNTSKEFAEVAERFLSNEFFAVELPLSCPHTPGFGVLAGQNTPEATYEITKAVKEKTSLPVIVKLSPISQNIAEIAQAAEKAGADAINMGNTHGPGMAINIETREPVLDFKIGGVSGPAIKPIAIRCVYDLYKAVKIPIIGTGGISNSRDAIEMMMAGATLVGVGSAVYYEGEDVFEKITKGMNEFLQKEGYDNISEIIGATHD
ncbi:MAG: dihydroorotate dehydrogenase [Candidatus Nanoarchaeia archaeon]